jgi:hypothetical protein
MLKKDRSDYFKSYKKKKLEKLKSGPADIYEAYKKKGRESVHKYQEKNRPVVRQRVKDYRDKRRLWFQEYKTHLQCKNCTENNPVCLCFHHRDPNEKDFGIGQMKTMSESRILEEIAKCDVLCANCHLKLHYGFQGTKSIFW